jgi:hypothetical protein
LGSLNLHDEISTNEDVCDFLFSIKMAIIIIAKEFMEYSAKLRLEKSWVENFLK